MKSILSISLLLSLVICFAKSASVSNNGVQGECYSKSCTSSTDCARSADDFECRCTAFHCGLVENKCGGGCIMDSQCAAWSEGDDKCVCNWMFECELESARLQPGYETYMKFLAATKRENLQKKLAQLTKEEKEKEMKKYAYLDRV